MKKAYKTPVVKVIEAEAEELICQSLGIGDPTSKMGPVAADANSRYDDDEEDWGDMWQ